MYQRPQIVQKENNIEWTEQLILKIMCYNNLCYIRYVLRFFNDSSRVRISYSQRKCCHHQLRFRSWGWGWRGCCSEGKEEERELLSRWRTENAERMCLVEEKKYLKKKKLELQASSASFAASGWWVICWFCLCKVKVAQSIWWWCEKSINLCD